ncbi:hypothetical protein TNCV_3750651 [Trichonephila clavipes]|nr:hypothetical protein TNCV_3750651 [Trichonephila clavipes]
MAFDDEPRNFDSVARHPPPLFSILYTSAPQPFIAADRSKLLISWLSCFTGTYALLAIDLPALALWFPNLQSRWIRFYIKNFAMIPK